MPILVQDLVAQIPSDTEKVVSRTRSRFNNAVRQMLRQETGLRLAKGRDNEEDDTETQAVRVLMKSGVPVELEGLKFGEDKRLAILIAPWRAELERLRQSASRISRELVRSLPGEIVCMGRFADVDRELDHAADFAEHLLKISDTFNLVKELHAVEDDILGQYRWSDKHDRWSMTEDRWPSKQEQISASVHLYWGVIGLVARALGVSVEGLTVKVLAHELAHAYTHLGADIDGHRWDNDDFRWTMRAVKEGLAQYYTRQLLTRLRTRIPEAEIAYQTLLPHQPDDYRVQESWIEGGATPEHIRLAMVLFRRGRKKTLLEFTEFLEQAKKDLGKRPQQFGLFE